MDAERGAVIRLFRNGWRQRLHNILREIIAIWRAMRDRSVPLKAKITAVLSVAYLILPLDVVPDFIPVLGWLDDLVIVPLLCYLAGRMAPQGVMERYRHKADMLIRRWGPKLTTGIVVFIVFWLLMASLGGWMTAKSLRGGGDAANAAPNAATAKEPTGQGERERIIRERFSLFGD
jgi:uncharacterized membrane protein YkvA (DUF1232 family)